MKYDGKLYGRMGRKHFDTGKTGADWDAMEAERDRYRELVEELLASDEEISSVTDDELFDAAQKAPCPTARKQAEVILAARQALKAGKEGA